MLTSAYGYSAVFHRQGELHLARGTNQDRFLKVWINFL